MGRLQRVRGHFYNWYDTRDLRPLEPRYVSTVDSGNLAGHLIALANACREWSRPSDSALRAPRRHRRRARHDPRANALVCTTARQTQTVTLHQLDDALAAVALGFATGPAFEVDGSGAARRPSRRCRDHGRHCRRARDRTWRRDRRGYAVLGAGVLNAIDSAPPRYRAVGGRGPLRVRGSRSSKSTARSMALAMEFGFLLDHDRQLLSIGYLVAEGALDPNCYDLLASEARLASFFAIAKGDVAGQALVPPRPRRDAGRARRRADLLVGIDVRISDALARHARAGRKPARADEPTDRAPPDRLRREARPALGHFRIRLQRARSGTDLSIFQFRRSRPRAETRPWRKQGDRALRNRSGCDGRSASGGAPISSVWPRSAREAAMGSTRLWTTRRRAFQRAKASRSSAPSWRIIRA